MSSSNRSKEEYLIEELTRKHGHLYPTDQMRELRGYSVSKEIKNQTGK
jgi:hypothetical protein